MSKLEGWTTIGVSHNTHDEVESRGKKGESFNNVIRRFMGLKPEKITKKKEG
jgi:hypothetical protein